MWSSGQCARLLSDDPSSNPAEANSLLGSKLLFEKNGDKQNKRPRMAHLKNQLDVTIDCSTNCATNIALDLA